MHGYGKALLCLACFGLHLFANTAANPSNETAPLEQRATDDVPLFLTPYILNGSIDEAQRRSKVDLFESRVGAKAHSGYVTVNESTGSNLFFLYVKAANNRSGETPLVLWLEGGPGKSALFGQFLESGPLGIGPDGQLYRRRPTLQEEADVVYLDQPVGGGYSFATDRRGFARTLDDIADSIEEFLRQFLVLFPENRNRRFYAIGESYGARSALGIVNRLQVNRSLPLRVSGVILGVPFVAPLLDLMDSSDYLYSTGLIDGRGHRLFAERFQQIKLAAGFNRTIAAALLLKTVFNAKFDDEPTLYQQLTGYTDHGSVLRTRPAPEKRKYRDYVTSDAFKRAIHVGGATPLEAQMLALGLSLAQSDYFTDISDTLANVLDSSKVLLYTGQMDTVFPAVNTDRYLRRLKWSGQRELECAQREAWYSFADAHTPAGYVTRARNLTYVLVSRAGHHATFDRPEALFDLTYSFIHGRKYRAS
ncbi:venom serine carboxypeptidase-like [Dermacentor albipictus]|uniref:venom serine carboxypeptidase-like n=1 Tax=Dermacentor albipictus TaxID=60249 RepID=UPI0031FC3E04